MTPSPDGPEVRGAAPPRPRVPWHIVYYLLAAFDVLTVSAAVYVTRRLLDVSLESVSRNREWGAHIDEYAALRRLAADVNAPGNDVFDSHDAAAESVRLARARAAFGERVGLLRLHLTEAHPAEAVPLLARLDDVTRALGVMAGEGEDAVAAFGSGETARAARRMAAMDRSYAGLLALLDQLHGDVRRVQERLFAEQTAAVRKLHRYEVLFAILIVLMVSAAIVYGRRLQREMRGEAEARERYVDSLRNGEEELRRAHAALERRMEDRTKALRDSEAALIEAASEWRRTFDAIDSPVMILDLEGRMVRANATVRALLGQGAADGVTGRIVTSLGRGEPWETVTRVAAAAREARAPRSAEAQDAATGRSWDVTAYLAEPADGGAGRIIAVAKDTTRLLELRETLRREENMAAMGALVAGVAHEVRNPVFAISSTLDALEARYAGTAGFEKYFAVLRREVDRLGHLMRDLLDYGRPPRLAAAPIGLERVVADAVRACEAEAAAANVTIECALAEELPEVVVDAERVAQVFENLIHNAVQHTPAGGRVVVEARAGDGHEQRYVECSVRDSGPGFRPEDLPHVFRPLFTRRPGGTGLGLAIAQRIVEMHGGSMGAANAPQGGALVTLRLPVEPVGAAQGRVLA
jgi:PAS domain S-box-containing protein